MVTMSTTQYCTCNLLPDEDLVRRFRLGEEDAFTHIYDRYRQRVMQTAFRIVRNADDAQDATQEIFMKLYRALPEWDSSRARLSTWLYRVAANHAIDQWRGRRRRTVPETDAGAEPLSDLRTPLLSLEHSERLRRVMKRVSSLPRLQKRFFLHRYLLGRSLEEIATIEGRSLGTVKGLLHRATHTVRRSG
jgi:RNA polymerase sigma factor (sigma-70 family)